MATVLIADTDPSILDFLPRIVSDHLPHVAVDICSSIDALMSRCNLSTYDTIAISPILLQGYRLLKHKADRHLLAPLLVIASPSDRTLASMYLRREAFDLIVKPIVSHDAVQTVGLALWQNRLLQLLASKDCTPSRCQEHIKIFPPAQRIEAAFEKTFDAYEQTFNAFTTGLHRLLTSEEEGSLFHIAGFVESITRKQAFDRLVLMC